MRRDISAPVPAADYCYKVKAQCDDYCLVLSKAGTVREWCKWA